MQFSRSFLVILVLCLGLLASAFAQFTHRSSRITHHYFLPQDKVYTDPVDRYQFTLESDWQEITNTDSSGARSLKFVFRGNTADGDLRVRKTALGESNLDDFMKRDEAASLRYLPGYVKISKQEYFGGGPLTGKMIEFNFKRYNKDASGRYYYLTDKKGNVWTLQFAGRPNIIHSLRPHTDHMARTFKPLD